MDTIHFEYANQPAQVTLAADKITGKDQWRIVIIGPFETIPLSEYIEQKEMLVEKIKAMRIEHEKDPSQLELLVRKLRTGR